MKIQTLVCLKLLLCVPPPSFSFSYVRKFLWQIFYNLLGFL